MSDTNVTFVIVIIIVNISYLWQVQFKTPEIYERKEWEP